MDILEYFDNFFFLVIVEVISPGKDRPEPKFEAIPDQTLSVFDVP